MKSFAILVLCMLIFALQHSKADPMQTRIKDAMKCLKEKDPNAAKERAMSAFGECQGKPDIKTCMMKEMKLEKSEMDCLKAKFGKA